MEDFEEYNKSTKKSTKAPSRDDFPSMISDLISSINWKVAFFLLILGVLIFSDVFVELFLTSFDGAVYAQDPTTKGTFIQLILFIFGYITIDLLVKGEII